MGTKFTVLRSYRQATGHLAPRPDALWGEDEMMAPVGARGQPPPREHEERPGKDPERATVRAAQLTVIAPDWNCPWPLDWQRHRRVLTHLADTEADGVLPDIQPGVLMDGDDLGKWLAQQKQPGTWTRLMPEQQERLSALGIKAPRPGGNARGEGSG